MKLLALAVLLGGLFFLGCTASADASVSVSPTSQPSLAPTYTPSHAPTATPTPTPTAQASVEVSASVHAQASPWPGGVTTVDELSAQQKPIECSQNEIRKHYEPGSEEGLDGHTVYFVLGTRAKKTFRANINNQYYDANEAEFYDQSTFYGRSSLDPSACTWYKNTENNFFDKNVVKLSDFFNDFVPENYSCVLGSFTSITLPVDGSPCPQ